MTATRTLTLMSLLLGALAVLAAPAAAQAADGDRQTFDATFTTGQAGQPTGLDIAIDYVNPDDPDAKPPAVAEVVLALPDGARIDTAAVPQCDAPDPLLILLGARVCPEGSVLGSGELTLATGLVQSEDDITLLNAADEFIFLTRPKDVPLPGGVVTRSAVEDGSAYRTAVPPLPGLPPPDTFTALDEVNLQIDRREGPDGAYLTTPPSCPDSGAWTTTGTFTYRDGVTQEVTSASPCAG